MNRSTDTDRTTSLIIIWCDIGIHVCLIVLKLMFTVGLGLAWFLLRVAKR